MSGNLESSQISRSINYRISLEISRDVKKKSESLAISGDLWRSREISRDIDNKKQKHLVLSNMDPERKVMEPLARAG
jgi:hypothetical protein